MQVYRNATLSLFIPYLFSIDESLLCNELVI